jgi:hypothetical protein
MVPVKAFGWVSDDLPAVIPGAAMATTRFHEELLKHCHEQKNTEAFVRETGVVKNESNMKYFCLLFVCRIMYDKGHMA